MFQLARRITIIFLVAAAVNYPWELAQSPLYEGLDDIPLVIWHCFRASLGDAVLVLLIFAAGLVARREVDWFEQPDRSGYLVMLAAGLAIGMAIEWAAVHIAQRWTYTERMPLIPGLDIGIVPVAQMLIVPPLVFRIVGAILRTKRNRKLPGRKGTR